MGVFLRRFSENVQVSPGDEPHHRLLSINPVADRSGVAGVVVTVTDEHGHQLAQQFTVTVVPVNDAPTFTATTNDVVSGNHRSVSIPWAENISSGTAQENDSDQFLTFELTMSQEDQALFAVLPTVDVDTGVLHYTPDPYAAGMATVMVTLRDGGGVDHDGQNATSTLLTITIEPLPQIQVQMVAVNPDPRAEPVDEITIVFAEPVIGFDVGDLQLRRDGGANLLDDMVTLTTVDQMTWVLGNLSDSTVQPGQYVLTLDAESAPRSPTYRVRPTPAVRLKCGITSSTSRVAFTTSTSMGK